MSKSSLVVDCNFFPSDHFSCGAAYSSSSCWSADIVANIPSHSHGNHHLELGWIWYSRVAPTFSQGSNSPLQASCRALTFGSSCADPGAEAMLIRYCSESASQYGHGQPPRAVNCMCMFLNSFNNCKKALNCADPGVEAMLIRYCSESASPYGHGQPQEPTKTFRIVPTV